MTCQKISPWQHLAVVILSASRLAVCHGIHLAIVTALIGLSFGKDNFFFPVLKVLLYFATSVGFSFVILYNSDSGRRLSVSWDLKSLCCCIGDKKERERWLCLCVCKNVHSFSKYGTIVLPQEGYKNCSTKAQICSIWNTVKYFELLLISNATTRSFQQEFSCHICWPSCSWSLRPIFESPTQLTPTPVANFPQTDERWSRLCVKMWFD